MRPKMCDYFYFKKEQVSFSRSTYCDEPLLSLVVTHCAHYLRIMGGGGRGGRGARDERARPACRSVRPTRRALYFSTRQSGERVISSNKYILFFSLQTGWRSECQRGLKRIEERMPTHEGQGSWIKLLSEGSNFVFYEISRS